jgi:RNA recognition motif-containing protein
VDLIQEYLALTMQNKLFVGSLPWAVDDAQLGELFKDHGEVVSASVVTDKESGRSRGFGFVEFATDDQAAAAVAAMEGATVEGRTITVSIAKPKQD